MKEVGKTKTFKNGIPNWIVIVVIEAFDINKIGNDFYKLFTEIVPKSVSSIATFPKNFNFMNVSETMLQEYTLQNEELEEAFNNLKSDKSPGFDDISSSTVNFCIIGIFHPLKHIFNL